MSKINIKKVVSIIFFAWTFVLYGQPGVTVIASGDRYIEPANRTGLIPKIIDTTIETLIIKYPLLSLKQETKTEVDKINPASIKTIDKLTQLYRLNIRLGVGTGLMPLGQAFFESGRSKKFLYGAQVKHLSSFDKIKGYAPASFDRTKAKIYGGINNNKFSLKGNIHYNNQGLHYYSASDTLNLSRDSILQRYSDFGIKTTFKSHKKDSLNLNYNISLSYNNYLSKKPKNNTGWRAKENQLSLRSSTHYKHKKEQYSLDLNLFYNGYRYGVPDATLTGLGSGIVFNNTIINLKPKIITTLQENRFKAKVGLDITADIQTATKIYVYPLAEIKYSMFNNIFIPYAGLRGGLIQNTFKELTQTNEFLRPNIEIKNEKRPIEFYGGVKGTLSKNISFNTGIVFSNVRDKALYIIDTMDFIRNKFNVVYDTINITTINASISYCLDDKIKLDVLGRYNSYSPLQNSYAWNLPRLEFLVRGSYNLFDKFLFNLDLTIEEGRKTLVHELGEAVFEENGQYIKNLGFIADVNMGVEYRYSKRISAFVEFNNIASQRYQRWYNTPVQGFQFLGGVTFKL